MHAGCGFPLPAAGLQNWVLQVAKLYHKNTIRPSEPVQPERILSDIQTFLSACRSPAVLEYGDETMPLTPGAHVLEIRSGKVWIDVWNETRSVSRQLLKIEARRPGVLDCTVQRFGGKPGRLSFLDLGRPQTAHRALAGLRENFREQFRRMLSRQFPAWEIKAISCGMDLQRSLSPVFPRACLKRGNRQLAAIACPPDHDEAAMLTFGLIWHHHIRSQSPEDVHTGLCLFLPETAGALTAHRLRWLTARSLNPRIFRFNQHGLAGEVDPQDLGNLDTSVAQSYAPPRLNAELERLLRRLHSIPGVGCCPELSGAISIRAQGIEFARIEREQIWLGLDHKQRAACHTEDVERFAARFSELLENAPQAAPERWLESGVRIHLSAIDPCLLPEPVHGQVLTFAGNDRELLDLLAISPAGRLAVLELKTAEDIHLPLQALDYWMRIAWHAERNELQHLFPGIPIARNTPKLYLLAPAMSFHPSNPVVLSYFSPEIEVERTGINPDWQKRFHVVLRLKGAEEPISHRSCP